MRTPNESQLKPSRLVGAVAAIMLWGVSCLLAAQNPSRPTVGAIRWDAWTGGEVTREVERSLGPAQYHARLPWFAQVGADGRVRMDGSPQSVMDQEIAFASAAGLDYWAFLLYPETSSMSQSLKNYLTRPQRDRIRFCLILHNSFGVSEAQWPKERDRAVALLKEPGYQTVLGPRPLVYAFWDKVPAQRFAEFQRAAQTASLNPYCVYMGWNPAEDFRSASTNGFQAVSAYAYASAEATFASLCRAVEKDYWQNALTARVPYIPLVTTGWDKRPRKDHPVSWEKDHAYHRQTVFPAAPTPQEIAFHLEHSLQFVQENPAVCAANTILIYAWNEHDEGGWLEPTWTPGGQPDTTRLDAISRVLKSGSAKSAPPSQSKFRVLALAQSGGHHVAFTEAAKPWLQTCGEESGFTVDFITNTAPVTEALLTNYQVVLHCGPPDHQPTTSTRYDSIKANVDPPGGGLPSRPFLSKPARTDESAEVSGGGLLHRQGPNRAHQLCGRGEPVVLQNGGRARFLFRGHDELGRLEP